MTIAGGPPEAVNAPPRPRHGLEHIANGGGLYSAYYGSVQSVGLHLFCPFLWGRKKALFRPLFMGCTKSPLGVRPEFAFFCSASALSVPSLFKLLASSWLTPDQDGEHGGRSVRARPDVSVFGVRSESGPQRQYPRLRGRMRGGGGPLGSLVLQAGGWLGEFGVSPQSHEDGLCHVEGPRRAFHTSGAPGGRQRCPTSIVGAVSSHSLPHEVRGGLVGRESYERSEDGRT